MDDTINNALPTDINNDIEVITDEEVEDSNIIPIEQMLNIDNNIEKEEITIENNIPTEKKKDKILMIQIILLIAWAILTLLVYFFGYDLLSPFIKV